MISEEKSTRTTASQRRQYFRYEAKRMLAENGNLMRLIGGLLVTIAISDAFVYAFQIIVSTLTDDTPLALYAAETVLLIMLAAPLILGLFRMGYEMCMGKDTKLSGVLHYYNSATEFFGALGVVCRIMFVFVVSVIIALLCWLYVGNGIKSIFLSYTVKYICAFAVFALCAILTRHVFLLPAAFFAHEDGNAFSLVKISLAAAKGNTLEIVLFNFGFIGLFVLSVLSFGILFVVYTIPLYILSYSLFASYILQSAGRV